MVKQQMFPPPQLIILSYPMASLVATNREYKQISPAVYNSLKIQLGEKIYCFNFSVKEVANDVLD